MLYQHHLKQFYRQLCFTITAFCIAHIANAHVLYAESNTTISDSEYAYQDIYASLIPDNHPYPTNFPYQITLTYSTSIDEDNSLYEQDLQITAIRIYDGERLVQELPIQAKGLHIPEFEDINSDGYMDLTIPQIITSTSGEFDLIYTFWLYNPQTQLFKAAPI